jgi:hypothetical protein
MKKIIDFCIYVSSIIVLYFLYSHKNNYQTLEFYIGITLTVFCVIAWFIISRDKNWQYGNKSNFVINKKNYLYAILIVLSIFFLPLLIRFIVDYL